LPPQHAIAMICSASISTLATSAIDRNQYQPGGLLNLELARADGLLR
jgi:hypothetical protein